MIKTRICVVLALLALAISAACYRSRPVEPATAPEVVGFVTGEPVVIYGNTGNTLLINEAGALATTATLTGSSTVSGLIDASVVVTNTVNVQGSIDASVVISNTPSVQGNVDGSVVVTNTVNVAVVDAQAPYGCTPIQFYGVNSAVIVDSGAHVLYSGSCFNRGATAQYVQLQVTSTGPLIDAGPACLQWYIPASNSEIFLDPRAPGGVNMNACTGLAPGAISFDVSGSTQFYVPDAGNVDCNFCWL